MRSWAFTFFILAVIAGLVGFTSLAFKIAQFSDKLFFISAILCIGTLIFYIVKRSYLALGWTCIFLALAVITGVFAYTNFTTSMVYIAKISFFLFVTLFILALTIQKIRKRT